MSESDLVERLRAASHDERLSTGMLYREAADEIERLRAELSDSNLAGTMHAAMLLKEQEEVKRLRAELADTTDILTESALKETNKREAAEAERDSLLELLREAHELFADDLDHLRKVPTCKGAVMLARIDAAIAKEKP